MSRNFYVILPCNQPLIVFLLCIARWLCEDWLCSIILFLGSSTAVTILEKKENPLRLTEDRCAR
jgi:hypothetical protein